MDLLSRLAFSFSVCISRSTTSLYRELVARLSLPDQHDEVHLATRKIYRLATSLPRVDSEMAANWAQLVKQRTTIPRAINRGNTAGDKQSFHVYRLAGIGRHDGIGAKNISVPAENINSSYTTNRTVFFSLNACLHQHCQAI